MSNFAEAMRLLGEAIDKLKEPYIPPEEECAHLAAAIVPLIKAYRVRDHEGQPTTWTCNAATVDGVAAGKWEVTLRPILTETKL